MEVFEIYGTEQSSDINPNRTWEWLGEVNSLKKAKSTAIRVSSQKMWYEVEIRGSKNGETIHHSYWRNGKLNIDMSV